MKQILCTSRTQRICFFHHPLLSLWPALSQLILNHDPVLVCKSLSVFKTLLEKWRDAKTETHPGLSSERLDSKLLKITLSILDLSIP